MSLTIYKLIVLYMLENSRESVTYSQITEFILDGEYTSYFHLQQALSELAESGLVTKKTISNISFYEITEDGKNTLHFFEQDLTPRIREDITTYLENLGYNHPKRILTPAEYYLTSSGEYAVRCRLIEKGVTILDLNIAVPGLEAAESICGCWTDKCQDIYANIMEELL